MTRLSRSRRLVCGFTLVEFLAAVALLAIVAASLAGWIQASGSLAHASRSRWSSERTLQAIVDSITADLRAGDVITDTPRITIGADGALSIHTRAGSASSTRGPVTRTYRWDASGHSLWLEEAQAPSAMPVEHLLHTSIQSFEATRIEEGDQKVFVHLFIATLEGHSRTVRLPWV